PDVLIIPYAYVTTKAAWEITKSLGAKKIILLHMPKRNEDIHNLWNAMEETTQNPENLIVLEMGQEIEI
ncbi:MAG: hypothetical protein J6V03_01885, partial [Clostridia bacterium]|nr:hypothetical protein [Clostridia bacterium]